MIAENCIVINLDLYELKYTKCVGGRPTIKTAGLGEGKGKEREGTVG